MYKCALLCLELSVYRQRLSYNSPLVFFVNIPLLQEGNPYYLFGPVVDTFLRQEERVVPLEPLSAIRESANRRIPLLLGLSENEGSVMLCE